MDDRVWKEIPNAEIRHIWRCPDCGQEDSISPDWYQHNGTVVCGDCDRDADYVKTEILVRPEVNSTVPQTSERPIQLE